MGRPYPIEFCGNCGIGQRNKEENPCFCDYYSPGIGTDNRCTSWTPAHFLHYERVVYICSPMKGNIAENVRKAQAFCAAAIASHAGIEMGIELLKKCDEIWVFGEPSEGMRAEIEEAKSLRLPVVTVPQSAINKILKKENESNG